VNTLHQGDGDDDDDDDDDNNNNNNNNNNREVCFQNVIWCSVHHKGAVHSYANTVSVLTTEQRRLSFIRC
jgi:hypothetical protein